MACGYPPSQFTPIAARAADYRFLIFEPGVVERIELPDSLLADKHVLDAGLTVQVGDTIRPLHSTSDRAGFLVTIGETVHEAVERADQGCRAISIRYADGKTCHAAELVEFRELTQSL